MANDLCFSTTCKFTNNSFIPTVILHDLSILCSFIVSHPLYFSYFIFFSPYLFKLIFFISPLFFTTSILVLLSFIATAFPHSKLGFVQTMVDKLRSKVNDGDDGDEFRQFEEFEIYKIVFRDPPLVTVGDAEVKQVVKLEEERSLESLFEELDRFDDSSAIEMKENVTRSKVEESAGELSKLELVETPIFGDDLNSDENLFSVKSDPWRSDSSRSFGSYGSLKLEEAAGELQKLVLVEETPISGDDQNSDENSFSVRSDLWRSDSSRSFGSCGSLKENETRSYTEEVAGELQKSSSGNDKNTVQNSFSVKSNSTVATISISGDDKKTVQNSFSVKSISPATKISISSDDNKTVQNSFSVNTNSPATTISISGEDQKTVEHSFSIKSNSWRLDSSSSFCSYGSMRKEKEWKRTLACKLFEERNNSSNGEEGMDSLWEAYEDDNSSRKSKNNQKKKTMVKSKKKNEFKCFVDEEDEDEDDDDEDEFMSNGQLCCLKALKLSTGKMNLGMGKPNLVKITKAIKGFGWLHHVGSKHGKRN